MAMKHVHAEVIGELQLDLQSFTGGEVPDFLHGIVWVTWSSVAAQALLRNIMDVHGTGLAGWVCENPLLRSAKGRPRVKSIEIEP